MHYRTLGQSGIRVSRLALGYWAVSDPALWGAQDRAQAIDAVHAALDHGINLIDTAEGYGGGTSETLLGQALSGKRDQAIIATKVSRSHLRPDQIMTACEASLRRLKIDCIDLYQIHWADPAVPLADSLDALITLRDQGKIRAIAVSNFGPHDLAAAQAITPIASNQVPYNLFFRAIEYAVLPFCREHNVGVLAYSPFLHGILTGKFTSLDVIPPGRKRSRHFASDHPQTRHSDPGVEAEMMDALARIRHIADGAGLPMARLVLAWALHQPDITSVIAGARSPQQVAENALAADTTLGQDVLDALDDATAAIKTALGPNPDPWESGAKSRVR